MNKEYKKAIKQAEVYLADAKERGADALINWEDVKAELFTHEEIAASQLRIGIMSALINARNEQGLSQRDLEKLSGVKQPIISRMEACVTIPQLDTVLKVLAPLGKTLYVGDFNQEEAVYVSEHRRDYNAD
jgi:ribosome-binding protein aMBF1 (putative translation factor)